MHTRLHSFAALATATMAALVPSARAATRRSVVEAIPPEANEALFVGSLEHLDPAVEAMGRLFGSGLAFSFLESAALPNLAMETISSPLEHGGGLDPRGGWGCFGFRTSPARWGWWGSATNRSPRRG